MEYVAKHITAARTTMSDAENKKQKKTEARALRRRKKGQEKHKKP
jgi:hypothetical protein